MTNSKGKSQLNVKIHKALYGMLWSALLFYRKLVVDFEAYGFEINPYDPCVANMTIGGSQLTVVWHVDNLLVSHKDSFEITKLAVYLEDIYGGLLVKRGKVHDYLGMTLDFSKKRSLQVSMIPYLNNILQEFPEKLGDIATSPGADHLFKVRPKEEARILPEEQAVGFHHTTAQSYF